MPGLKIPPIDTLCVLLFRNLLIPLPFKNPTQVSGVRGQGSGVRNAAGAVAIHTPGEAKLAWRERSEGNQEEAPSQSSSSVQKSSIINQQSAPLASPLRPLRLCGKLSSSSLINDHLACPAIHPGKAQRRWIAQRRRGFSSSSNQKSKINTHQS
jgi:hypothetical protein